MNICTRTRAMKLRFSDLNQIRSLIHAKLLPLSLYVGKDQRGRPFFLIFFHKFIPGLLQVVAGGYVGTRLGEDLARHHSYATYDTWEHPFIFDNQIALLYGLLSAAGT